MSASCVVADAEFSASLQMGVGYESNVYLVDHNNLAAVGSWVLSAQPELQWRANSDFSVSYSAQGLRYTSASAEDHIRHNLTLSGRGALGALVWQARTQMTRVQGSQDSIVFVGGRSAWASASVRDRRDQWQNRSSVQLQHPVGQNYFVRAAGQLSWFDLDINPNPVAGYDHFIDRYEMHGTLYGGVVDFKGWELALGVRRGYIKQGRQGGRTTDRTNHYTAFLLSGKGKLTDSLSLSGELGPSVHRFDEGPGDLHIVTLFAQVGLDWRVHPEHTLRLAVNNRQWVSGTGRLSNTVLGTSLTWRWQHASAGNFTVSTIYDNLDYDGVDIEDVRYTVRVGWDKALTDNLRLQVTASRVFIRDQAQGAANRESQNTIAQAVLSLGF